VLCRGAKSILIPFASSADDSLLVEISSADHGIRFIDQDGYQTESPFGAIAVLSISAHTYDGTGARKTPAYFKYEVVLKIAATSKQSEVENAVALGAKRAVISSGFPASLGLNGQVGRVTGMSSASGPARVMIALMTASRLITTEAVDSAGQVHPLKELVSPYAQEELSTLRAVQAVDTLYLFSKTKAVRKLVRNAENEFSIAESTHEYTSAKDMTGLSNESSDMIWRGNNNPIAGTFFHNRFIMIGETATDGAVVCGSHVNHYAKFRLRSGNSVGSGDVTDETGIYIKILSREHIFPRWIVELGGNLVLGTSHGIWLIKRVKLSEILSGTNIIADRMSTIGTSICDIVLINEQIIFIDRSRTRLYELVYDASANSYAIYSLSSFSEHFGASDRFIKIQYDSHHKIVWVLHESGALSAMTYDRDERVVGWHHHTIGGNGKVRDICVLPHHADDSLFMIVERTLEERTFRTLERLLPAWTHGFSLEGVAESDTPTQSGSGRTKERYAHYVDSGRLIEGDATRNTRIAGSTPERVWFNGLIEVSGSGLNLTVSGLWWLPGAQVTCYGNGINYRAP